MDEELGVGLGCLGGIMIIGVFLVLMSLLLKGFWVLIVGIWSL